MFEEVIAEIESRERFLLTGHERPDGDCLGAQVALYHLLKSMGKDVTILNADPVETSLRFLERHTPFGVHKSGDPLPEHDVHVLLDCHELSRCGSVGVAARAVQGVTRMVVDHHVGADQSDGRILLWDVSSPSTGAVVYDLYRRLGAPLSPAAAEGIFVTLVSDTGWFRYSNTDEHALAIAADLVGLGVRPNEIYREIHHGKPVESVGLLSAGLGLSYFVEGGRIAVLPLPRHFMTRATKHDFNTDALLDVLREIQGVDVVAMLKEIDEQRVKLSLRASERVDVDGVAKQLGGGGHHKASGATIGGPLQPATERVLALLRELLGDANGA